MKKYKITDPVEKANIAIELISGKDINSITKKYNISAKSAQKMENVLRKNAYKAFEISNEDILRENLDTLRETHLETIENFTDTLKEFVKLQEYCRELESKIELIKNRLEQANRNNIIPEIGFFFED